MTETIELIVSLSILLSGLFMTLVGFDIIKLKAKKPEDVERMIEWRKKFGKIFKIAGIIMLLIGIFLLIAPNSNNESEIWTQSQKNEMKKQVIEYSVFFQNIDPELADSVVSCFVEKYTTKYTLKESWEQNDNLTQDQILELTLPLMRECMNSYGIGEK